MPPQKIIQSQKKRRKEQWNYKTARKQHSGYNKCTLEFFLFLLVRTSNFNTVRWEFLKFQLPVVVLCLSLWSLTWCVCSLALSLILEPGCRFLESFLFYKFPPSLIRCTFQLPRPLQILLSVSSGCQELRFSLSVPTFRKSPGRKTVQWYKAHLNLFFFSQRS